MQTVLIVEDQPDCAVPLARMLEGSGYRALVAEDGRVAIGFMQALVPNLVLLDILLPSMDGFEFLSAIRPSPQYARTPVVAYTALRDPETRQRLNQLGVCDVLHKGAAQYQDVLQSVRRTIGQPGEEKDPN